MARIAFLDDGKATMRSIGEIIWYIESHFSRPLDLNELAEVAGVSRYHLLRTFMVQTGTPVMSYVRSRRLAEAARALAAGAPDILNIALDAGYSSHEAFTRAFKDQFGETPGAVRSRGDTANLVLTEPFTMTHAPKPIEPERMVDAGPMKLAGLVQRYACGENGGIPAQWQRFRPHIGFVPGQRGGVAYGVCLNMNEDGDFDYAASVEVEDDLELPAELACVKVPAQRYAVFRHEGHVSALPETVHSIWAEWFPRSGEQAAEGPNFERYDAAFDGVTGFGGVEIWIPIVPSHQK